MRRMNRRTSALITTFVIALVAITRIAAAQTTPIKIVVPIPAGGVSDLVARLFAEQIGRAQGLTIVVDNRPGAATVIGTEAAARAAPDGNTLLINAPPAF